MGRLKNKPSTNGIEAMQGEASWLLSHAQALADYGREEEAAAERARAAGCEELLAYLLEADGQALEAAIHRVSAASCYEKLGQPARAVTLLRAALSAPLHDDHRARVEQLLGRCLARAPEEAKRVAQRRPQSASSAVR
jgi:hypothetical protein